MFQKVKDVVTVWEDSAPFHSDCRSHTGQH